MGLQFRYQNGEVQINHNWFLGYTKDENGHLIIDEEQAVVVRRIFREYLQGASLKNIADGLMRHFLQTQTSRITEYDEQLVRRLIEKITVYDDKLIFEFKSGMTIELKR